MTIDIERLSVATTGSSPVSCDWQDMIDRHPYGEGYEFWSAGEMQIEHPDTGESLDFTVVVNDHRVCAVVLDGEAHETWDDDLPITEQLFDAIIEADNIFADGPMFNAYYPLGGERIMPHPYGSRFNPVDAALRIEHTSMVVVRIDDEYVLGLAGAGMDFSWSICAAYVRLGYLPPVHFSDLPRMAGPINDKQLVLDAMRRSLRFVRDDAERQLDRLSDMDTDPNGA